MNKQTKTIIYVSSLLLMNIPLMSYAEKCENAQIINNTTESLTISFENSPHQSYDFPDDMVGLGGVGSGNGWIKNYDMQNCYARNGPCIVYPGQSISVDYTTDKMGFSTGLVDIADSESRSKLNFKLFYTNAEGDLAHSKCPTYYMNDPGSNNYNTVTDSQSHPHGNLYIFNKP